MNIILCGLPKSGKTTVGKELAKRLAWDFIDTDTLIEKSYYESTQLQKSCREIFISEGEKAFRNLEREQIATLTNIKKHVIATGGGTLCDSMNMKTLKKMGEFIYLKADQKVLWKRIVDSGIPAYLNAKNPKKQFEDLVNYRIPLYESVACLVIDADGLSIDKIVDKIKCYLIKEADRK